MRAVAEDWISHASRLVIGCRPTVGFLQIAMVAGRGRRGRTDPRRHLSARFRPSPARARRSRARQPRLGLVDAFSLDGQRQLVLVRRDNIEHLIMIGGPNDVLLESQIIRAAAAATRESRA